MRRLLTVQVWAATLAMSIGVCAQPADQELLERGVQLRRQGQDAQALELFRLAFEQHPSARARAQIALAEQAVARWVEAEADLLSALEEHDDPWVAKHRASLEESLAVIREHLGTVQILCDAAGATVRANGVVADRVSEEGMRVPAGHLLLEIEAPGYVAKRLAIIVSPGAVIRQRVDLAPVSARGPSASRQMSAPTTPAMPFAVRPTGAPDSRRTLAWAATAAAGILLAEGVIAHIVREDMAARYNDDNLCSKPGYIRSEVCGEYRVFTETAETLAVIGYGAGALAAAAAGYLFASTPSRTGEVTIGVGREASVGYLVRW